MPSVTPDACQFARSVIRAMTLAADECGAVNLSQGMPDFPVPEWIKNAACAAIAEGCNQYTPPFGDLRLREAVAEHAAWHLGFMPDPQTEVTITCGSTEGMYDALRSVVRPGAEVIIPSPYYENYWADCVLTGATPRFVSLVPPDWRPDLDEITRAFNKRTCAILLCNPNNPTGTVYRRPELEHIAHLCQKVDAVAITDEVYEHILFDGLQHVAMAALDGMRERSVTISSASKTFSVTGWRVGTVIAPPAITAVIRQVHDYTTICAPAPLQAAIASAYRGPREYYRQLQADYQERRDVILPALIRAGFTVTRPEGAYYCTAGIGPFNGDDNAFAQHLLRQAGVATVPGSCFFADRQAGRAFVRFSFCKSQTTLQEAIRRLDLWKQRLL